MRKILLVMMLFLASCGMGKSEEGAIDFDVKFNEDDYQKIVTASNDLGFNVLKKVKPNDDNNTFISPVSLYMALSMAYNGAAGVTKDEMAEVMQAEGLEVMELNRANISLLASLYRDMDSIELTLGNSLWLNEDFHFSDQFAENATKYFNGKIQEIDIFDPKSPDIINKWVKETTNGNIEEIVDEPLNERLIAFLINTIYFKGNWQYPFSKNATKNGPFYLEDGSEADLPFMQLNEEFMYFQDAHLQAVKLPYGEGGMSMNIFLPNEEISLEDMVESLQGYELNEQFTKSLGTVSLPKFTLEYEATLNDVLQELGMKDAFERETANFSHMLKEERQIYIFEVKQKTYIQIDEKGTEASAATSIEMRDESAPMGEPFTMEINRPFFLTITDELTDTILFMGTINQPKE